MTHTPNRLSARRVTLMASVAGLGLAVLLTGPSAYRAISGPAWTGGDFWHRVLEPLAPWVR